MSLHQLMQHQSLVSSTCAHYKVDDCYFSQSEIREIFDKMHKRRYRCDFCDFWYVGWPHVILNQLNKERLENTSSFLACPTCHTFLFNGTHDQRWRVRMVVILLNLIMFGVLTYSLILPIFIWNLIINEPIGLSITIIAICWDLFIVGYLGYMIFHSFHKSNKRIRLQQIRSQIIQGVFPVIYIISD